MNILEELKFFDSEKEVGIGGPILLTILNLPSILFEIFPFIILILILIFIIKIALIIPPTINNITNGVAKILKGMV